MNQQEQTASISMEAGQHDQHHAHSRGWRGFTRHYFEMVLAMLPGCMVGCVLWGAFLRTWADRSGLTTIAMGLLMSGTMAAWMFYRRHSRRDVLEMSASMLVVPVVLIPFLWVQEISSLTIHAITMVAMLPAMLAVMVYRRQSYA